MKKNSVLLAIALCLVSCVSTKKKVDAGDPYTQQINWPEAYNPEEAGFFVHNAIDIKASPETVRNILIQAETWPNWYEGAENVAIIRPEDMNILLNDSAFTWKTMGLNFESVITEYEPYSRLSWESKKSSIKGYHAWLIVPTEDGCKLITQESQTGFLTSMQKVFQPKKLEKLHQIWLEEIMQKAEQSEL